jgi:hypothetical protein
MADAAAGYVQTQRLDLRRSAPTMSALHLARPALPTVLHHHDRRGGRRLALGRAHHRSRTTCRVAEASPDSSR